MEQECHNRRKRATLRFTICTFSIFLLLAEISEAVVAATFTKALAETPGEADGEGEKASGTRFSSLVDPATLFKSVPKHDHANAIVASAPAAGYWRFTNAIGETRTIARADEIKNAIKWLAPVASELQSPKVAIYLSGETFFSKNALSELPKEARFYVVLKGKPYKLVAGRDGKYYALIKQRLALQLKNEAGVKEALWQLARPVNRHKMRLLSLNDNAPKTLPFSHTNPVDSLPAPEPVNPYALGRALKGLRGQSVLLVGRVRDDILYFKSRNGPDARVLLSDVRRAAVEADVGLVVISGPSSNQPGSRNALWQQVQVIGLEDAITKATIGDFLGALGFERGAIVVSVAPLGRNHVILNAISHPGLIGALAVDPVTNQPSALESLFIDLMASITGDVSTYWVQASLRHSQYEDELRKRIVPGVPADYQFLYLGLMAVGLLGLPVALGWWRKLWPLPPVDSHRSTFWHIVYGAFRLLLFSLFFMPLVALVAITAQLVRTLSLLMVAPFSRQDSSV